MSFQDKFEHLSDEAMSLRMVEKFLHEVETSLVRPRSEQFDLRAVRECLRILRPKDEYVDPAEELDAECRLRSEFDRWREELAEKDREIEAFHIRRFCDGLKSRIDRRVFLSLARFYRCLPFSHPVQSKFDLAVTRAFSIGLPGGRRRLLRDRAFVSGELAGLYLLWDEGSDTEIDDCSDAVGVFDRLLEEVRALTEFESLVQTNIFERIREAKRNMGRTYFHPDCVAAAVECNIEVGNAFDSLLAALNSDLHGSVRSKLDFASTFLDVTSRTDMPLLDAESELLIFGEMQHETGELAFMRRLLKRATCASGTEDLRQVSVTEKGLLVKDRLADVLTNLAAPEPNRTLVREHMIQSPFLDALDLNDYLFTRDGEPDILGRRALAAILCLEEFREHDLKGHDISAELSSEAMSILNFAESLGESLNESLAEADQAEQNRLLTVANTLLGVRLQVERAVVRFAAPAVEEIEAENNAVEEVINPKFELTRKSFLESNKWLMAATFIVVIVCSSILFFSGESASAVPLPEDVEQVARERLPHDDHIEQAFRKGDTLFVSGRSAWEKLSDDEKRTDLQKMVELELHKPLQNVIVIDPTGRPLADLSANGPTIHEEPPMAPEK